jgi:homoserine O-acetyltransferase
MPNLTLFSHVPDFVLSSGHRLPARVAYVAMGTLNEQRDNAVLVTHGFTSSHRFILPGAVAAEGSWSALVGPGKAIDTDRYFVISSNALGSCFGTTGPADRDPNRNRPYAADFPTISFEDIAALQHQFLSGLGVTKLHAVVGVSMGGMQALQWAVQYSHQVERVGVALSAFSSGKGAPALEATLAADPAWNGGHPAPGAMVSLMTRLRADTLRRYGMATWLTDQGLSESSRDDELMTQASMWASEFDPCSLLVLRRALDTFDVRPLLGRIRAPVLLALNTTDVLFPASAGPRMLAELEAHGVRAKLHVIDSPYGHLASGVDWHQWSGALKAFVEQPANRKTNTPALNTEGDQPCAPC